MDSEQDIGAEGAQEVAYAGAGARLRAAREARRLELAHIASETRIPLRHLEAIEAGDFGALPSRTYAIGFSRTFARAVGLDEAAIADSVRAELADGHAPRAAVGAGMEPGDPAKLPSAGLAWFGAFAALVLAVGLIAFFNTRFGAGSSPEPLVAPPAPSPSVAATAGAPAATPAANGPVVLTALENVWVRVYDEGGERLLEKELVKDESFTVPVDAVDPRINTGRPDLLAISVGGARVPPLSDKPETMARVPISAAALLARTAPATTAAATPVAATGGAASPRPVVRRMSAPAPTRTPVEPAAEPAPETAAPVSAPSAAEPAATDTGDEPPAE